MTTFLGLGLSLAAHAGVVQGGAADLEGAYKAQRVAVLVGVQDYGDPALQGLRFPAKDAHDLAGVLRDPTLGGFDRVVVVEGGAQTTADKLRHVIAVATADLQRDDTFLLYLSGHGTLTLDAREGSRLWFLPSDGVLDDPEGTGIAIADLEAMVGDLPARRRVLMMDTCHNGRNPGSQLSGRARVNNLTAQLLEGLRGEPPAPRSLRQVSESEARLYAAQYHQPAMEDPNLQNGVYTHYIIQALTRAAPAADLDGDGLVDVTEAHDYARDHTMRHTGGLQTPRAEYRFVGREEIFLSGDPSKRSRAEKALLSACDEILAKARLFVDGIARGPAMGVTAIDPGRRSVELRSSDGRVLASQKLTVEEGTTVPLEDLFQLTPSTWAVAAGVSARAGAGSDPLLPVLGEVEVAWLRPFRAPRWLRLSGHARFGAANGRVSDLVEDPLVTVGANSLGLGAGLQWGELSVGPSIDVVQFWRSYSDSTGPHQQSVFSIAPGGHLLWTPRMGERNLLLRVGSRYEPFAFNDSPTSVWQHGLGVGFTGKR